MTAASEGLEVDTPRRSSAGALAALAATAVLAALGTSIANIALPALMSAFAASMGEVQWVILAFLLAGTMLIVPVGHLGDRRGRRAVLSWGIVVFTLGSAVAALSPDLALLVGARALQGAGAAAMAALTVGLVRETVPADRLGGAMGVLGASTAVGMALGPSLGGALLAGPGWRAVFGALVPLGVLSLLLVRRALPATPAAASTGSFDLDAAGTLLLSLTLGAYALAVTVQPGGTAGAAGLGGVAALGCIAFLRVERAAGTPLVDVRHLAATGALRHLAASLLGATIMMSYVLIGPFYLTSALGLDAAHLGLTMAIGPVAAMVTGVPAGRLVDRLGAKRVSALGLAEMTLGLVVLVVLGGWAGIVGFVLGSVVLTPGNQLFMAANNTSVMTSVGPDDQGAVSGTLNLARNVGMITGASVLGLVYRAGAATAPNGSAGAIVGMQVAFAAAAALGLLSLALTTPRGRRRTA